MARDLEAAEVAAAFGSREQAAAAAAAAADDEAVSADEGADAEAAEAASPAEAAQPTDAAEAASAEAAKETAEALEAAESSIEASVDHLLAKTEQILQTGQPAFINIPTARGTIALEVSTNFLNFLAKNRKTILGAALLMHTIENNPSINHWLPGWNFEIVDDPIANTQRLIEQMQSLGMLDILSNIRARLSGRTLSSEQRHLAILMTSVSAQIRNMLNIFARFAVRWAASFVVTEMFGPLSVVQFSLQMAWAAHQRQKDIMKQAAAGAISTIIAGAVGGPGAAAMAAATNLGQAMQKMPPTPFALPTPSAASSSSSPADPAPQQPALQRQLGDVRVAQERREASEMANPDQRPTTVATERGIKRKDRPKGKVPNAVMGILPSENMDYDVDGSINDFTRRLKALDGDPTDRACADLIESRSD